MSDVQGSFSVYTGDVIKMAQTMEGAPKVAQREILRGMRDATSGTRDTVRAIAPHRSGFLKSNIETKIRQSGSGIEGQVLIRGSKVKYAWWADQGRGPVVPKNKKVLRFIAPNGGVVFTKYAKAFPGHKFMERGLKQSQAMIDRTMDKAIERVMRYLQRY